MLLLDAQGIGWITCVDKVIKGLEAQPTVAEDCLWPLCKSCHNGQKQALAGGSFEVVWASQLQPIEADRQIPHGALIGFSHQWAPTS